MKRRDFITAAAATAGAAMVGCGSDEQTQSQSFAQFPVPENQPNILFMMVDEMRFPTHFPAGITTPDEYLARFMPNLYAQIWSGGVRFDNYRVAAGACTPSRGVMLTGLYSQQTWVVNTISGDSPTGNPPPSMPTQMPTYGKLLQLLGYDTPYFGKFHVTVNAPYDPDECQTPVQDYLAPYGFRTYTCPDPAGSQGQGFTADPMVADQAIHFLQQKSTGKDQPFCATVSFVNPHDYEFFWGGTEPDRYAELFDEAGAKPLEAYDVNKLGESRPGPQSGFPPVPPNFETVEEISANKPSTQVLYIESNQALFGGVGYDPARTDFRLEDSLILAGRVKKGMAPFPYWKRGLDSYLQILGLVDQQIGRVMEALSPELRSNTVVVFVSDHGDYCGSHGMLQGKEGNVYEEALRVPLVVRDFTGRYAADAEIMRNQLSSSIDLMPFLVTLGNGGSSSWIQGDLATLYGSRHDLLNIVRDRNAVGREYAVYTTDEYVNPLLNFNGAPTHILALMQANTKLGLYGHWVNHTVQLSPLGRELEFYDHSTPSGKLELDNEPGDPRVPPSLNRLLSEILPGEIRKPLPPSLSSFADANQQVYLAYIDFLDGFSEAEVLANIHLNFGKDGFL